MYLEPYAMTTCHESCAMSELQDTLLHDSVLETLRHGLQLQKSYTAKPNSSYGRH